MLDMNDAPEQRSGEPIPDGTFVKLTMSIRPGEADLPGADPMDRGLFKASKSSDALMLDLEFTLSAPPEFAHRKIFEMWVVAGGSVDEKGVSKGWNMTKQRIRAMLESATGTDPKDMSPQAKANRMVQGFRQLDNIPFYAKLTTEPGNEIQDKPGQFYMDKNKIDYIVVPGMPEYAALAAGQPVEARPKHRTHTPGQQGGTAAAGGAGKPAWERKDEPALPGTTVQQPAAAAAPAASGGPAWLR